jgi:hypothetical protein
VATLGGHWIEILFKLFVFRPDRDDFDRFLLVLAATPLLSTAIKSLRFDLGTMSISNMAKHLSFEYMKYYNLRRMPEPDERSKYSVEALEIEKNNAIREYGSWIVGLHTSNSEAFKSGPHLREIFPLLGNLERIDVSCRSPPVQQQSPYSGLDRGELQRQLSKDEQGVSACYCSYPNIEVFNQTS